MEAQEVLTTKLRNFFGLCSSYRTSDGAVWFRWSTRFTLVESREDCSDEDHSAFKRDEPPLP